MNISGCIGCYQCYNTGSCVYDDDMKGIIDAVRGADAIVICSPVYTCTVPGGLKLMMDRFLAFHAEQTLFSVPRRKRGLMLAVAGKSNETEFGCTVTTINSFMRNIDIEPEKPILIGAMDQIRDIRTIPGMQEKVRGSVMNLLSRSPGE